MTKPFDAQEFLARVRARTRTGNEQEADGLSFGNIRLVRSRQELICGARQVKLREGSRIVQANRLGGQPYRSVITR